MQVSREALVGAKWISVSRGPEHLMISVSGVRRLVVGASGSPGSLCALRYARDLAGCGGIAVVAVHAWVPPGGDVFERRCSSAGLRRVWADAARERHNGALAAAWGSVSPGLDIQLVVIRGEPGPALVEVADSAADLLIVGAGRHGRLGRTRGGRVSRYCLAHARCPVLAVPQPATARQMGLRPGAWALRHWGLTVEQALRQ